jgi:hypothetical protein
MITFCWAASFFTSLLFGTKLVIKSIHQSEIRTYQTFFFCHLSVYSVEDGAIKTQENA